MKENQMDFEPSFDITHKKIAYYQRRIANITLELMERLDYGDVTTLISEYYRCRCEINRLIKQ